VAPEGKMHVVRVKDQKISKKPVVIVKFISLSSFKNLIQLF